MTDIAQTPEPESGEKPKTLRLHKETLRDLAAAKPSRVQGGARPRCTAGWSGCTQSGE